MYLVCCNGRKKAQLSATCAQYVRNMSVYKLFMTIFHAMRIKNNPIRYISPHRLRGIKPVHITLTNSLLSKAPSMFSICSSVEKLYFRNNNITNVSFYFFNNCTKLYNVKFEGNSFQRLHNLLSIALTLEFLEFSHNFISGFTTLQKTTVSQLIVIRLQGNRITNFQFDYPTKALSSEFGSK